MIRPLAFVAAWLLLCGVVAVGAHQTNELVEANRAAIEEAKAQNCGIWLSVFIVANDGVATQLPPREAERLRKRIAADFEARCKTYVQTFP